MKVYVLAYDYDYDGMGVPFAVFSTKRKAENYVKKHQKFKTAPLEWFELTVDKRPEL